MKTNIQNINDLRAERARLKNQLQLSQIYMRRELAAIKTEINPARQAVGMIGDMLTAPQKGLLNVGVGIGIDTVIRRGLLARAGWLPRLIIPFIARNVASNLIQKNRTSIVENALMWVKKVTDKPKKVEIKQSPSSEEAAKTEKKQHLNGSIPIVIREN